MKIVSSQSERNPKDYREFFRCRSAILTISTFFFFFVVVVVVVFESKELSQYKGDLIKHTNKQTQMVTNNRIGKKRKNR